MTRIELRSNGDYVWSEMLDDNTEVERFKDVIEELSSVATANKLENVEIIVWSDTLKYAQINVYNGGRYGRKEVYTAIIKPHYFKNGNVKQTQFTEVKRLQTIQSGYNYRGMATQSATIAKMTALDNFIY